MKGILALLVVLVLFAGIGFWWWSKQILPPDASSASKTGFVVIKNETAGQIVRQLVEKGLIRSSLAARIFLLISNQEKHLQAGSFVLSPNLSLAEVFQVLTGPPADVWVTIPEGWRREQIAARLAANLTDFNPQEFIRQTATLEGRLFPDTYLIPISATPSAVIQIMNSNFMFKVGSIDDKTLIIASLVEREANSTTDRPIIAGILWKRLKAGWPLQVDATVQYARGDWSPATDTRYPSIYNTYLHPGLPPTPIANPGLASINAAKNPQNSPYWFYLHTADGSAYYAKTVEEHNSNIDKYLRP